ncbi:MAG: hypothetical protein ABW123_12520 [Cystobacter sp.]
MSLVYEPARDSVTVDVAQAPVSVRTSDLTNLFVLMTTSLQGVEDAQDVELHLASGSDRRLAPEGSPGFRWAWAFKRELAVVGAMAVLAMILGVWFHSRLVSPLSAVSDCAWLFEDALLREMDFLGRGDLALGPLAYPMPKKPWTKQAVAPCQTDNGEVEINKGCWIELAKKPPCFSNNAEYQGKCYMPVRKPEPVPQSVHPDSR